MERLDQVGKDRRVTDDRRKSSRRAWDKWKHWLDLGAKIGLVLAGVITAVAPVLQYTGGKEEERLRQMIDKNQKWQIQDLERQLSEIRAKK